MRNVNSDSLLFTNQGPRIILVFNGDKHIVRNSTVDVREEFLKLEEAAKHVDKATIRTERRDRIGQNSTMDEYIPIGENKNIPNNHKTDHDICRKMRTGNLMKP